MEIFIFIIIGIALFLGNTILFNQLDDLIMDLPRPYRIISLIPPFSFIAMVIVIILTLLDYIITTIIKAIK